MADQTFILKDSLIKILEENEASIRNQSVMATGEESISRERAANLKGQAAILTEVLKVVKSGSIDHQTPHDQPQVQSVDCSSTNNDQVVDEV